MPKAQDPAPRPAAPPATAPARPEGIVLVVDDDDAVRELLHTILRKRCQVLCAGDAEEAAEILRRHPVQVIVCDHQMPGETGLSFLARLRDQYPRLQRILLTGHTETALLLDAINRSGVRNYLVKPIVPALFLETVRQALADQAEACRLRQIEAENAQLRDGLRSAAASGQRRLASLGRLLALGSLGLVGLALAALLLGVLVFVLLYFLKSGLGIDLIPGRHFWPGGS